MLLGSCTQNFVEEEVLDVLAGLALPSIKDGVDAFLDLTLADDLELEFTMTSYNTRVDRMAELLNNPANLIGLGDGGAHVDMLCDSGYPAVAGGADFIRHAEPISRE